MSGRIPRVPTEATFDSDLAAKTASLKGEIVSIINGTEWPAESKGAANSLLNTIESSPGIPNGMPSALQELQGIVKQYIRVLEDVHVQLNDASSKSSMKRWNLLQRIQSTASNRPSKCTLLLKTCQDDVSKAANSLLERLDQEQNKRDDLAARGISSETHTQPNVPTPEQLSPPPLNIQTKSTEHATAFESLPPKTPQNPNSFSGAPEDHAAASPIPTDALIVARKNFKIIEAVSRVIPVVGTYVGAVAKVGLAFVEAIQNMDENGDLADDLGAQTAKLSKLLEGFTKKPNADQEEEIADRLNNLHKALQKVHHRVNEWNSLGRFRKAFHSRDVAELRAYLGTVQVVLEEMQLLVNLDIHCVITEMKNFELGQMQRHLLRHLGDGQYGAQGHSIEDVICWPGTRVKILERIDSWIRNSSDRILWIRGMAGQGKSTIASTVLHSWRYRASCAIFHFRRGQHTLNGRIICALARQLATSLVPEVKNAVLDSVQENEDIAHQRLNEQFETLFVVPFTRLDSQAHLILIIVDALDECDDPKYAIDFVRLIYRHSAAFTANVKFLLTSRPETSLLRALEPTQWLSEDLNTVLDVTNDLERFLHQAFRLIRHDHGISEAWPSSEDVKRLAEMSQGLFRWARNLMTYVSEGSPVHRLRAVLRRPSAWGGLDDQHHQILSKAFDKVRLDPVRQDILWQVLGILVVAPCPVSLEIICGLYGSHDIFKGVIADHIIQSLRRDILADLNSLLFIPPSPAEPMRLLHTSIRDLLTSDLRCRVQPYYIDPVRYHQRLANMCFRFMREHRICNLSDLSRPSSEVQDVVEREVLKAVQYSCRAWSTHLAEGVQWPNSGENATTAVLVDFESFSREKVICWLEVLRSIGAEREAANMANRVHRWLMQRPRDAPELNSLATLWNDVQRFIALFSEPISLGLLHVYVPAHPHCPLEMEMWELYGKRVKFQTLPGVRTSRYQDAEKVFRVAYEIHSRNGNDLGAANVQIGLGEVYSAWWRCQDAEKAFMEAHEIYSRIGSDLGAANALLGLGDIYDAQSKYSEAEKVFMEAHEIHSRIGNDLGAANARIGLGKIYSTWRKYQDAENASREAYEIHSSIGSDLGAANALLGLGDIYDAQLKYSEAEQVFLEAHETYSRIGKDIEAADAQIGLANIYSACWRYQDAEKAFGKAHDIHSRIGDDLGAANALAGLGETYNAQSRYQEAEKAFSAAHDIHSRIGDDLGAANALAGLGETYNARSRYQEAEKAARKAHEIHSRVGNDLGAANALIGLGDISNACSRYTEAETTFAEAQKIYSRIGNVFRAAKAGIRSGETYNTQVKYPEADGAFKEALGILSSVENTLSPGNASNNPEEDCNTQSSYSGDGGAEGNHSRVGHNAKGASALEDLRYTHMSLSTNSEAQKGLERAHEAYSSIGMGTEIEHSPNNSDQRFDSEVGAPNVPFTPACQSPGEGLPGPSPSPCTAPSPTASHDISDSLHLPSAWMNEHPASSQMASAADTPANSNRQEQALCKDLIETTHIPASATEELSDLLQALEKAAPKAVRNKHKIYSILRVSRDICNCIIEIGNPSGSQSGIEVKPILNRVEDYCVLLDGLEETLLEFTVTLHSEITAFGVDLYSSWSQSRSAFAGILRKLGHSLSTISSQTHDIADDSFFDDCSWLSRLLYRGVHPEISTQFMDVPKNHPVFAVTNGLHYLETQVKCRVPDEPTRELIIEIATLLAQTLASISPEDDKESLQEQSSMSNEADRDWLVQALADSFSVLHLDSTLQPSTAQELAANWADVKTRFTSRDPSAPGNPM